MRIFVLDISGAEHALEAEPGLTLAQVVYAGGAFEAPAICSALGRCGKCRMRFLDPAQAGKILPIEENIFSAEELAQGWRLGCRRLAASDLRIALPASAGPLLKTNTIVANAEADSCGLVLDLGSTNLEWEIVSAASQHIAQGRCLNPQMGAGSEIMSRLAYAADTKRAEALSFMVIDRIRRIVAEAPGKIERLCIAGNPAMIYLLLNLPLGGLSAAPYHLNFKGGIRKIAPDLPTAYIPPFPSPFIGADASAGLAFLEHEVGSLRRPYLLADLGTNGEFILSLSKDRYYAASIPMGPALEGIGLSFGSVAGPGVITDFKITPDGITPAPMPGETVERRPGISGSGYLALVHKLLLLSLMDRQGAFRSDSPMPLAARTARNFFKNGEELYFGLSAKMFLSGQDVEQILKVKAAFNLALSSLLRASGLRSSQLKAVYLAGALGLYIDRACLLELGFLPPDQHLETLGNTSLKGARLLLENMAARQWVEELTPGIQTLDLASDLSFRNKFMDSMIFDYVP